MEGDRERGSVKEDNVRGGGERKRDMEKDSLAERLKGGSYKQGKWTNET